MAQAGTVVLGRFDQLVRLYKAAQTARFQRLPVPSASLHFWQCPTNGPAENGIAFASESASSTFLV
jgi:hypothetical protein